MFGHFSTNIYFFHRKTSLKQKSTTDQINFPGLNIDQTATLDDPAHYQELGNLKNENAHPKYWREYTPDIKRMFWFVPIYTIVARDLS